MARGTRAVVVIVRGGKREGARRALRLVRLLLVDQTAEAVEDTVQACQRLRFRPRRHVEGFHRPRRRRRRRVPRQTASLPTREAERRQRGSMKVVLVVVLLEAWGLAQLRLVVLLQLRHRQQVQVDLRPAVPQTVLPLP